MLALSRNTLAEVHFMYKLLSHSTALKLEEHIS